MFVEGLNKVAVLVERLASVNNEYATSGCSGDWDVVQATLNGRHVVLIVLEREKGRTCSFSSMSETLRPSTGIRGLTLMASADTFQTQTANNTDSVMMVRLRRDTMMDAYFN